MKRFLPLSFALLLLGACVDTTGLSEETSRTPKGNPNAAVVVAEYADIQCPACRAAQGIVTALNDTYGNQISFEFHHFPLRSMHRFALDAAEAAECAADQGKFWEYVDLAYAEQADLSLAKLTEWGTKLNLDMELFERCRKSHIKRDMILREYEQASKELGVTGTPTFFVNGERVETGLDTLSKAIDEKLQGMMQRL